MSLKLPLLRQAIRKGLSDAPGGGKSSAAGHTVELTLAR
jgi:hypothetical protein